MKHNNFLFLACFVGLLWGCEDSGPQYLDEVTFDDPYIRNCVYKMEWQFDASEAKYVKKHGIVSNDGVYYHDTAKIPLDAASQLVDCRSHNRDNQYGGQTQNEPEKARHLQDLSKLPNLTEVALDFPVDDYSAITRANKVSNLTITQIDSTSSAIASQLPLSAIGQMKSLKQLYLSGDIYSDWSGLQQLTNIESLVLNTWNQLEFSGAQFLPSNIKGLSLFHTPFDVDANSRYLADIEHFTLWEGDNYQISDSGTLVYLGPASNFSSLSDMNKLKRVNINHFMFSDVGLLPTDNLIELNLTMWEEDFDSWDMAAIRSINNLRALSVRLKEKTVRPYQRHFAVSYLDTTDPLSSVSIPIGAPVNQSYFRNYVTQADRQFLQQHFDLEVLQATDFGEGNVELIQIVDLSSGQISKLFNFWYSEQFSIQQ